LQRTMSMTQRKFAIIFSITRMQKHSRLYFKAVSSPQIPCYQLGQTFVMASSLNADINGINLLPYQNQIPAPFFNTRYISLKVRLSAEAKRFVKKVLECGLICRSGQKVKSRLFSTYCFLIGRETGLCVH